MRHVSCSVDRCLGCRSCELACAVEHSVSRTLPGAMREPERPQPRIRVEVVEERGTGGRTFALQCRHCREPLCVQACISGGLRKDPRTGDVLIEAGRCVGCWSCVMVCPFGAIVRLEALHRAVKCDLCPGREVPACVSACPTGALLYTEVPEAAPSDVPRSGAPAGPC
jgi:carbon-monoxide dehydrogenase iron sulfur subunit